MSVGGILYVFMSVYEQYFELPFAKVITRWLLINTPKFYSQVVLWEDVPFVAEKLWKSIFICSIV
jgi:hypothetical protein